MLIIGSLYDLPSSPTIDTGLIGFEAYGSSGTGTKSSMRMKIAASQDAECVNSVDLVLGELSTWYSYPGIIQADIGIVSSYLVYTAHGFGYGTGHLALLTVAGGHQSGYGTLQSLTVRSLDYRVQLGSGMRIILEGKL